MKKMTTSADGQAGPARRRLGRPWLWFLLGAALCYPVALLTGGSHGAPLTPEAFAATLQANSQPGEYTYFAFGHNLWMIRHSTGTIRYYTFTESSQTPLIPSKEYTVDLNEFPPEQTSFLSSERSLTNYLWLVNRVTGKVRYLKGLRDATIEESAIFDLSKEH